jgi:GNAT superfamily N-acetyltransferase
MPEIDVVRTYLEMRDPADLHAARSTDPSVALTHVRECTPERYRRLYREVGERWHWRDRLAWSDERLAAYLADPRVEVWEITVGGETAGYFELRRERGETEIVYFGLVERFHGRGLGKHLLTEAVTRAWAGGATRVWLHTCTLDGPAALPNYEARGFRRVRSETYRTTIPG